MIKDRWESPEYLHPGHAFCAGCGFVIAFRHILKVLGEDTIVAITAGCLCQRQQINTGDSRWW
jgi:pyruvate/2-oxoacid:ferredoxin oxidoreductase beta subunit